MSHPTPTSARDPLGRSIASSATAPSLPLAQHPLRLYMGPLVTAAALLVALLGWAISEWGQIQVSQQERLRRFGEMFALFADVNLHQGPKPLEQDPTYAQIVLGALLSQTPSIHGATLTFHGQPLASAGDPTQGDTLRVVYPLRSSRAEPLTIPASVLSWGSGGPAPAAAAVVDGAPSLTLDLNVRPVLDSNRGQSLLWKVAISLAGIFSLAAAWSMSIRSRRVASELALARSRFSHLEELNVAAAGLAHEVKNPLGIILGLAQRLRASPQSDPDTRRQLDQVIDAADRAAERLSEFMNFARINTPDLAAVDARALIESITEVLRYDFEDAGVSLKVECAPISLWCDGSMLKQVLVNLLLNSLHASKIGGEVVVRLDERSRRARLAVADSGCGIPASLKAEVFKPYVTGRAEGHGLGLAIVSRIAECHGWGLSLDSEEGRGTTLTLEGIRLHGGPPSISPDMHAAQLSGIQGASS
jgi:two-component system, NtrC family, sensor histidine kinase HydH